MIDDLEPYPAYKDSGVPWLGDVPRHWKVQRGKAVFRCIDVRSSTGNEELLTVSSERGVVPRRSATVTMFKAESYVGGQARAMVVCSGIERAIQYFHAVRAYSAERKSPHQAIVAFSGEAEYGGAKVTEASLNGFPSSTIPDRITEDPYRFLVCVR